MGYKGTSLTLREWKQFFDLAIPKIKAFTKLNKKYEDGDPETVKHVDEYIKKMNEKILKDGS